MYPNWILQRAYLTPLRKALTFKKRSWTFQELNDESIKRARQLVALGIQQGDQLRSWGQVSLRL